MEENSILPHTSLLSSPCSSGFAARYAAEPANQRFGDNVQVRDQTTVGSTLETLHSQQKSSLLVGVTSASNSVVSLGAVQRMHNADDIVVKTFITTVIHALPNILLQGRFAL